MTNTEEYKFKYKFNIGDKVRLKESQIYRINGKVVTGGDVLTIKYRGCVNGRESYDFVEDKKVYPDINWLHVQDNFELVEPAKPPIEPVKPPVLSDSEADDVRTRLFKILGGD